MSPALSNLPGSTFPLVGALLAAVLLGGCDTASKAPEADPLPPTLSQPQPEPTPPVGPVSLRAATAPAAAGTPQAGARDEPDSWRSSDGPIFDWPAESAAATAGTSPAKAVATAPGASGPAPTPPAQASASTAPRTGEPPAEESGFDAILSWLSGDESDAQAESQSPPLSAWQLREQQMRGLPGWKLNGRVAISSPQESWSAVLRWVQVGDAFHVRLSTPLGQGLVDLRGVPGEVRMRTAEGDVYTAPDAETLLRDVAGMNLPVSGLRYWVLAVSDPTSVADEVDLDSDSLPVSLEQSGWRIEYDRYRNTGDLRLPDRLTFQGKDIDGRLIITQWDLSES